MERSEIKRHVLEGVSSGKIRSLNGIEAYFRGLMDHREIRVSIKMIIECVSELMSLGLIIPYHNESNYWKEWLGVSERGQEYINNVNSPYDPDGYLKRIRSKTSSIDPIVFAYLSESVAAFNRHLYFASAVTLGAASERLILLLVDSANSFIQRASSGSAIRTEDSIFTSYRNFRKKIDPHKKLFPGQLRESYETILDTLFNLIRMTRNDAGHPKKASLDEALVRVGLEAFGQYLNTVNELTVFLNQANPRP
jgi:hypothetical protein